MTSSLNHIPNPRSCEYYQFFTDKSSYEVYQKASNWRSGLWEGGKTLSWNCLVGVPQFILNRFIDLGKLACWTTQCLPICLVFKNSVNDLQTIAHEMNDEMKNYKSDSSIYKDLYEPSKKYLALISKINSANSEQELDDLEKELNKIISELKTPYLEKKLELINQ